MHEHTKYIPITTRLSKKRVCSVLNSVLNSCQPLKRNTCNE